MDLIMRQNVIQAVLTGLILFSALSRAMSNEISPCVDSDDVECVDFDNTENYCNVGQNISARVDIRLLKEDLELILYELERVSLVSIDKILTLGNTVKDKTFGSRFQIDIKIKPAERFGKLEIQMTSQNFVLADTRLMHVAIRLKNKTISTQGKAFFPIQPEQTNPETTTPVTPNKIDEFFDRMDKNKQTVNERDLWHLQENITKAVKQEIKDWHQEEQRILKHVYSMCITMITFIVILAIIITMQCLYMYMRKMPENSTTSTGVLAARVNGRRHILIPWSLHGEQPTQEYLEQCIGKDEFTLDLPPEYTATISGPDTQPTCSTEGEHLLNDKLKYTLEPAI